MIKRAPLFFLLLASLSLSFIRGQTGAQALIVQPTPPFLAAMPATASWQIDFQPIKLIAPSLQSSAAPDIPPAPQPVATPKQILVTKANGLRRETLLWSDGKQTENWIVGQFLFRQDPHSGQYSVLSPDMTPYDAAALSDFPDLSWINLHYFVGVKTKGPSSSFLYACEQRPDAFRSAEATSYVTWISTQDNNKPSKFSPAPRFKPVTVCIDARTKLPQTSDDGEVQATYTFNLHPAALTLPEACQKLLNAIGAARKQIEGQRMATPPSAPTNLK